MPTDSLTRTAGGVARAALLALAALLLTSETACRYPATEALVEVSSNAPRERVLRVSADVARQGTDWDAGRDPPAAAWQATAVPASFTVVPRGDGPRDERVLVVIRATLDAGPDPAREPALAFTRAARFSLVPRVALRVALRLNISCGAPASDCTSAGPDACTVSRRCDEQGLTCGDEGTCVAPDVQPEPIDPGHVPGGPSDAAPSDIGPTPDAPPADVAPPSATITQLSASGDVTCARMSDGSARCWGANDQGQLGDGTYLPRARAAPGTVLSSGVRAVAAASDHACALMDDGTVQCWGQNADGQLGDGTFTSRATPARVPGLAGVTQVAANTGHTCALLMDGTARCWGYNVVGQLGDGTTTTRPAPTPVMGLTGVRALALGGSHTCALMADGTVQCWGLNVFGQLGSGTASGGRATPAPVVGLMGVQAIALGGDFSCARLTGDALACWGINPFGQLGDGTAVQRASPVPVVGVTGVEIAAGESHTCARQADGTVRCWGLGNFGQLGTGTSARMGIGPVTVVGVGGATQLALGGYHACALLAGGGARCWGRNGLGQLGTGAAASRATPAPPAMLAGTVARITPGGENTCAQMADGTAQCWGYNYSGQLGDGTAATRSRPAPVAGLSNVAQIEMGSAHVCARLGDGTARCWGFNATGQLGDGTTTNRTTPVAVTALANVATLAVGGAHTAARLLDATYRVWGNNVLGQLGDGTTTSRSAPTAVAPLDAFSQLALGGFFSCGRGSGGSVQCWGRNNAGQLGDGTTADRSSPAPVTGLAAGVELVAAGSDHACAVLVLAGGVRCWGQNNAGQLGDGTTTNRTAPVAVTGLPPARQVRQLALGTAFSCARLDDATVWCWGDNAFGQLGVTDVPRRASAGAVPGLPAATQIGAGAEHACALGSDGVARCWGGNTAGELGDGAPVPAVPAAVVY